MGPNLTSLVWVIINLTSVPCTVPPQGMLGKSSVITMAVNSYIADTTTKEERTRKLGKLLGMNFLGLFVGESDT